MNTPQKNDQSAHLAHLSQPTPLKPPTKRQEVWSTARKVNVAVDQNELLLKVANALNPRRVTDMANDLHSKYYALNNNFIDNKRP
jgi:hypothetical protein